MKLKNNHFTKNELNQIDEADGLHISPFREDGKMILSRLDNDLSLNTPLFDVCHSFIGCFKLKYLIYNWSYDTRSMREVISRNWSPLALMKRNE